jgi:hypothetical protein
VRGADRSKLVIDVAHNRHCLIGGQYLRAKRTGKGDELVIDLLVRHPGQAVREIDKPAT